MKQTLSFHGLQLLLAVLSLISVFFFISIPSLHAAAPDDYSKLEEHDASKNIADQFAKMGHDSSTEILEGDHDSMDHLMGLEPCDDDGDDECMKRRLISEAHLDYIYTQHHKAP